MKFPLSLTGVRTNSSNNNFNSSPNKLLPKATIIIVIVRTQGAKNPPLTRGPRGACLKPGLNVARQEQQHARGNWPGQRRWPSRLRAEGLGEVHRSNRKNFLLGAGGGRGGGVRIAGLAVQGLERRSSGLVIRTAIY